MQEGDGAGYLKKASLSDQLGLLDSWQEAGGAPGPGPFPGAGLPKAEEVQKGLSSAKPGWHFPAWELHKGQGGSETFSSGSQGPTTGVRDIAFLLQVGVSRR